MSTAVSLLDNRLVQKAITVQRSKRKVIKLHVM